MENYTQVLEELTDIFKSICDKIEEQTNEETSFFIGHSNNKSLFFLVNEEYLFEEYDNNGSTYYNNLDPLNQYVFDRAGDIKENIEAFIKAVQQERKDTIEAGQNLIKELKECIN